MKPVCISAIALGLSLSGAAQLTSPLHRETMPNATTILYPALQGWHGGVGIRTGGTIAVAGFEGRTENATAHADAYSKNLKSSFGVGYGYARLGMFREHAFQFAFTKRITLGKELTLL